LTSYFGLLAKVGYCTIIYLLPSEAIFQLCVLFLRVYLKEVAPDPGAEVDSGRILHYSFGPGPGVKRNFWLANFLTSHHVHMHRVIFYISNTLRKLVI